MNAWRTELDSNATFRVITAGTNALLRFLRESSVRNVLTAPVSYSVCLPLILLDVWFSIYQRVCFPLYGVPLVRRSRYFVIERHHLAYLNGIEKLNCVYCGYVNSVLAYAREIAGRTELVLVSDQAFNARAEPSRALPPVRRLR